MNEPLTDKIDQYLQGSLSESDRSAFEQELANSPALQEDFRIRQDMAQALAPSGEEALRNNLHQLGQAQQSEFGGRWFFILLLVLLSLFILAWLMWPNDKTPQENLNMGPQQNLPIEEALTIPQGDIIPEESQEEAPQEDAVPQRAPAEVEVPTSNNQPLIIAVNFDRNPLLEAEMESQFRGGILNLELNYPINGDTLLLDGRQLVFSVIGLVETDRPAEVQNIRLYIYSNAVEDYQYGRYLADYDLGLSSVDQGWAIAQDVELVLEPGRYYYLFEWVEEEQLLAIGSLIVTR